jgi:hypothetical protein
MLQWTCAGNGARLCVYIHHTDAAREWAYDRTSSIGRLDKGLDEATAKGWTVMDMKASWVHSNRTAARCIQSIQTNCQASPAVSKAEPIRVEAPLLKLNLSDWLRVSGTESVTPRRLFSCQSALRTSSTVVRPPV